MGKRELLTKLLLVSGLAKVFLFFTSAAKLVVFNYHRIRPDHSNVVTSFDGDVYGPSISEFSRQMKWLKTNTTLVDERTLLDFLDCRERPRGIASLVTFDDAYIDNYTLAYPVLKELEIPAIYFVPTHAMTSRRLGWWDLIAYFVKQTKKGSIEFNGRTMDLDGAGRMHAVRFFQDQMKTEPERCTHGLLADLSEACEVAFPSIEVQDRELMTWNQVKEISEHGISIGSHTHQHRVLSTLEANSQKEEMVLSKMLLEKETKKIVSSIAYPVGNRSTFTTETQALAAQCGFRLGFSFSEQTNGWAQLDPYNVKRVEGPEVLNMVLNPMLLCK